MKKTYIEECLGRASQATEGPWIYDGSQIITKKETTKERAYGYWCENNFIADLDNANAQDSVGQFIAHARQDVPELCRRLQIALVAIHALGTVYDGFTDTFVTSQQAKDIVKELEAPLESGKK